jgi:PsbP-like protein
MRSIRNSTRIRCWLRGQLSIDPPAKRAARVLLAAMTILAFVVAGCSTGGSSATTTAAPVTTAGAATTTLTSTGASGSSTTVSSATTVPASAGAIKTYEDATYHYAFDYPKEWQFTEDVSVTGSAGGSSVKTVGIFDPKGDRTGDTLLDGLAISIYKLNTTVDESLMPAFKEELSSALPTLEGQLTDPVTVEPLRDASINGVPGFETTYTFNNGTKTLRSRMLFLVQGDIEYQITVQSVDSSWQKELPKLNLVLNSFRTLP